MKMISAKGRRSLKSLSGDQWTGHTASEMQGIIKKKVVLI